MEEVNVFEKQYSDKGLGAQRRYQNESFMAFLGGNYFGLSAKERAKLTVLELGCGSGAKVTRSYASQSQLVEYLCITAEK